MSRRRARRCARSLLAGDGIGLWALASEKIREAAQADRDPLAQRLEILVDDIGFGAWARGAAAVAIQASIARLTGATTVSPPAVAST